MNIYKFSYKKPSSGKLKYISVFANNEREALKAAPNVSTSDNKYIMYGLVSVEKAKGYE